MIYFYLTFIIAGFILIARKKNKSIFYLPLILLCIEVSRTIIDALHIPGEGFNGLIFIILCIFIFANIKISTNKRYLSLLFYITILSIYLAFRTNMEESFFNSISRLGTFVAMLFVIPVAFANKNEITREELRKSLIRMIAIYFLFIIIASVFKFGPNHYNTNIIFGFKFEQWYFGALLGAIYPFFIIPNRKRTQYYILYLIIIILLFLVLRRTVWFIIIFSSLLSILLARRSIFNKRYFSIITGFAVFVTLSAFVTNYLDIWQIRGGRTLSTDYILHQEYEEEGRFLEVEYAIYTLELSNKLFTGSGYLFDDVGRYNFPSPHRPIHGTYTKIFFGAGILGLILYLFTLLTVLYYLYSPNVRKDYLSSIVFSSFVTYLFVLSTGASGHGVSAPYVATLLILVGYMIPIRKYN